MPTKKPVNKPKAKPAAKPAAKAAPRKAAPAAKAKPAAKPAPKPAPKSKAPAPKAKPAKTPPAAAAKAPAKAPAKPTVKATPAPVSKSPAKAPPKAPAAAAKPAAKPAPVAKPAPAKTAKAEKPAAAVAAPAPVAATVAKPAPKAAAAPAVKQVVATGTMKAGPRPVRTDEDDDGNLNLLSGPRNVQPYQVRKGEEYMSKEQLNHFRTILETWKQDLMEEVDRTVTHMKDEAANPPDPNDRATLESEFSLELRTRDRERKLIRKIDEAIKRIEDGSYGYCLETGEEIGVKRLEARPVATLCLEAQERRERREKQYGDRDDRYRG